jgi:beta-glucanase (GH16 family)
LIIVVLRFRSGVGKLKPHQTNGTHLMMRRHSPVVDARRHAGNLRCRPGGLLVALVVGCSGAPPSAQPAGSTSTAPPPPPAKWTLAWSDEFDGGAGPIDGSKWIYDIGTRYSTTAPDRWGTGELETMTSDTANVALDGRGHLVIRPIRDAHGAWTSARIETQRNDFQPVGRGALAVEASIQQPAVSPANGLGYWPAFWMLGGPFRTSFTGWPAVGEIDILENVNGRSSVWSTFHCGATIPGPCHEQTGLGSGERACAGCLGTFHTYRLEWDRGTTPEELRWSLDGADYFTLRQSDVDASAWSEATSHGYMIILNVAMGGGFPGAFGGGPLSSTVSGVPMIVDYVRVYQR